MSFDDIRSERVKKLEKLKSLGINPYPAESSISITLSELVSKFESILAAGKIETIGGRLMSKRGQGAIVFADLYDGTAKFQVLLKKDILGDEQFSIFTDTTDVGDFIEVSGTLFLTKTGEKTLEAKSWKMLSKSLRPLPEKWHGLQDTEERFRRRYLDILMNHDVRDRFVVRSRIISAIRSFYDSEGFIEVETPRLQSLAGGATALPFVTHHNALDIDFYLTIAQELYLKELIAGGFTKVYEIGRKFRNEGIDTTHNPEFTMLESNEAYVDAKGQRAFIEELFKKLVRNIFEAETIQYEETTIDFAPKFEVITFYDLITKFTDIENPKAISQSEAFDKAVSLGGKVGKTDSLDKLLDVIYKKACRPHLIQPTFIIDYPEAFNPFSKRKVDNPSIIDRFQLVVGGLEIVNAFSELNDPIDQAVRYEEQEEKRKNGEGEISPSDKEYLEAMEYGMPPMGGIGIGIDRVAMLFTNSKNIREVILFPTLRPRARTAPNNSTLFDRKKFCQFFPYPRAVALRQSHKVLFFCAYVKTKNRPINEAVLTFRAPNEKREELRSQEDFWPLKNA